jgi:hypothetical protein
MRSLVGPASVVVWVQLCVFIIVLECMCGGSPPGWPVDLSKHMCTSVQAYVHFFPFVYHSEEVTGVAVVGLNCMDFKFPQQRPLRMGIWQQALRVTER